jgi:hypothetical protein
MKITKEISLYNFEAWSGAKDTLGELTISECDQLQAILEDIYPDGMDETQLNDILWFENDWIAECLGYRNWEHLVRDHKGISDEDHARTIIKNKFPNATDELIDGYIDEQWDEDDSDDTILGEFEEYMNDKNEEE